MKTSSISFSTISAEATLRFDCDFHQYRNVASGETYSFSELFSLNTAQRISTEDLCVDFHYCEIGNADKNGNLTPELLNFDSRGMLDENYYSKIEKGDILSVNVDDILISKVRPNLKKIIRITPTISDYFFTNAFISVKPKMMPVILYYCLRSVFFHSLIAVSRQGKGYPTLSTNDLMFLQFDKKSVDILRTNHEVLSAKILEIEDSIRINIEAIEPIQQIIDGVFAQEFGFDYTTFEEMKTHKRFSVGLAKFANNPDLRFSAKFHRDAGACAMKQLTSITSKKIKHYLSEPIVLGASVSPSDYSGGGEYSYISMATIKNWAYDAEDAMLLSKAYSDEKQAKTVRRDDILMARSGEGTIGKVALIDDEDLQGVFADFTMRIRLEHYNQQFAYYYMRTSYFQYLVEVYKKGLGNNTNIFPIVLQEFPIPDLSLCEQQRVVDKIHNEIFKQNSIKVQISNLRTQIDEIIENALT